MPIIPPDWQQPNCGHSDRGSGLAAIGIIFIKIIVVIGCILLVLFILYWIFRIIAGVISWIVEKIFKTTSPQGKSIAGKMMQRIAIFFDAAAKKIGESLQQNN